MKFHCRCGALIVDGTDDLPHKGHVLPDQEWSSMLDALDAVIESIADGKIGRDAACQRAREIVLRPSRLIWQCRACGRLYLDGKDGQLACFAPEGGTVDRDILRSRPS